MLCIGEAGGVNFAGVKGSTRVAVGGPVRGLQRLSGAVHCTVGAEGACVNSAGVKASTVRSVHVRGPAGVLQH